MILKHTQRRKVMILAFCMLIVIFSLALAFVAKNLSYNQKVTILRSPFVGDLGYFIPQARNSLSKIGNIIHVKHWLSETKLPQIYLEISPSDLQLMEESLPKQRFVNSLLDENKVFVKATFSAKDYQDRVEIRYRGAGANHWNSSKRSLLVRFPEDNPFNGMKSIDLVIPEDRDYLIEPVNSHRLERAGLLTKDIYFTRLNINSKDAGVYLLMERYTPFWLEKKNIPPESEVFSQTIAIMNKPELQTDNPGPKHWKRDIHKDNLSYDALESLFIIYEKSDRETFGEMMRIIFELDKWYAATAVNILAGSYHSLNENLNLLFNSATGKFEPLLEDINIYAKQPDPKAKIYEQSFGNPLSLYNLSTQPFYEEYRKILKNLSAEEYLAADLKTYDMLTKSLTPEFYKDQTKNKNDFYFTGFVKKARAFIKENYTRAEKLAELETPPLNSNERWPEEKTTLEFPGSFRYLNDVILDPDEFVAKYSDFALSEDNNIVLRNGKYTFDRNIVIPAGTKLTIEAGVEIYVSPGASLISYSPILAAGTPSLPVTINRADKTKSWGVIGVINAEGKSEFINVFMSGGSLSEEINGVIFDGMLSSHNSEIFISSCEFKDSKSHGITIKYSSGSIEKSKFFDNDKNFISIFESKDFEINR